MRPASAILPPPGGPPDPRPNRPRRSGWLVVGIVVGSLCLFLLLVIPVLAALLFPIFSQARESARRSACLSNVKELSNALALYVADHDERLPLARNWADSVADYGGLSPETWNCPVAGSQPAFAFWKDQSGKSVGRMGTPSTIPIVFEATTRTWNAAAPLTAFEPRHWQGSEKAGWVLRADGSAALRSAPLSNQPP